MADTDIMQQLLAQQSLIASSRGGNGGSALLGCIIPGNARDVDVFLGLSPKDKGFNGDKPPPVLLNTPQGGVFAKLMKSMGLTGEEILQSMKKVAEAGAPKQASIADIMGQGGFTSAVASAPSAGASDIGLG